MRLFDFWTAVRVKYSTVRQLIGSVLLCKYYIVADMYDVCNILRLCVCVHAENKFHVDIAMFARNAFVIFCCFVCCDVVCSLRIPFLLLLYLIIFCYILFFIRFTFLKVNVKKMDVFLCELYDTGGCIFVLILMYIYICIIGR